MVSKISPLLFLLTLFLLMLGPVGFAGTAAGQEISKKCEAYLALADEPDLEGYPVFLRSVRGGMVKAMVVGEKPTRLSFDFNAVQEKVRKQLLAKQVLEEVPGIWDVELEVKFDEADIAEKQRKSFRKACPAKLEIATMPSGVEVLLDGKSFGTTPVEIETGAGGSDLVLRLTGYRTLRRSLRLEPNEARVLTEQMVELTALHIVEPLDAMILVDGDYAGAAPTTIYLDEGQREIEVLAPGFAPWRTQVDLPLGSESTLEAELRSLPADQACYQFGLQGTAKDAVKSLKKQLVGERLRLAVPLYKVLTEIMENRVAVTHVLDGRRMLFEPRTGDDYVDLPWKLLGAELGGYDFGEVGVAIHHFPPEIVTITDVDDRKGRTVKIDLRYDIGEENSVYFDFTRKLRDVSASSLESAICRIFSPPPRIP